MAEIFNFSIAQKLPTLNCDEDGKRTEHIRDFINSIEFYHDTLSETSKPTLIKFILKCKIQGKALTELGNQKPENFASFKKILIEKCGPKETIETIQTKLSKTYQGNRPVREFVTDIETLITKMTELEVSCHGEEAREILTKANERRGLAFLKKGVNDRLKIVLDSARHTNLQDAIQHVLELDQTSASTSNTVRYMNNRGRNYHGHNNFNNPQPRFSHTNFNNQARSSYPQNNNSTRPSYHNQQNFRNRNNNNYRNNNNNYYNNDNRSRYTSNNDRQRYNNNNGNNHSNNNNNTTNTNNTNRSNNVSQLNNNRHNNQVLVMGNEQPTEGEADPSEGIH